MFNFFSSNKKQEIKVNILIVEDNPDLLELLKEFELHPSLASVNIIYASGALEAVNWIKTGEIDGVFSDVNMYDMDYLDNYLRKKSADIPVFRFSGDCPHHLNIRLVKPFSEKEYNEALMELVGLAKIVKKAA